MPSSHQDRFARLERRKSVARLYLKGWSQCEIAEKVGAAQSTVSDDLRLLRNSWKKGAQADLRAAYELAHAKLDALERELWQAWEDSHNPCRKVQIVRDVQSGREKNYSTLVDKGGDPRFLALLQKTAAYRRVVQTARVTTNDDPRVDERILRDVRIDRVLACIGKATERKERALGRERLAKERSAQKALPSADVGAALESSPETPTAPGSPTLPATSVPEASPGAATGSAP
jgi:transcriptional regulator with XRE-family HTH domain